MLQLDNGTWIHYNPLFGMTHIMALGRSKKQNHPNHRNKFCSKTKHMLTLFSVIATKPVDIMFGQSVDNIQ